MLCPMPHRFCFVFLPATCCKKEALSKPLKASFKTTLLPRAFAVLAFALLRVLFQIKPYAAK